MSTTDKETDEWLQLGKDDLKVRHPSMLFLCGCGQRWYDSVSLLRGNTPCGCTPTMVVVYGKK